MPTASPTRATLTAYEPPQRTGQPPGAALGTVAFQFNPATLVLSKGASWVTHQVRAGREVAVPEFTGTLPRRLDVELFLDSTATRGGAVQHGVETLLGWCAPTAHSLAAEAPCAPRVRFSWGAFESASFYGYLADVSATYSLFDADGTPLRATCTVQLTEAGDPTPRQNPTSGTPTAHRVHRAVAGDSLELLAYREYGDPTAWRVIAEANGLDDPMVLRPGTDLLLPSTLPSEPNETGSDRT